MKRYSTAQIIRETQMKTTMSYHHKPAITATIKKSTNNKCWRGYGEKGTYTFGGNVNWCNHYGKQYGCSHHGSAEMNLTSIREDTGSITGLAQ